MCELERGMEAVRRELEARDSHRAANNHVLRDFLANAADKCRRLRTESKHAQVQHPHPHTLVALGANVS